MPFLCPISAAGSLLSFEKDNLWVKNIIWMFGRGIVCSFIMFWWNFRAHSVLDMFLGERGRQSIAPLRIHWDGLTLYGVWGSLCAIPLVQRSLGQ